MFFTARSPGWQAFERLQLSIDRPILTAVAHGAEEALLDLLDDFNNEFVPTAEEVERRFRSLCRNRIRKQRRRVHLLFAAASRDQTPSPCKRVDDADELCFARRNLTAAEWSLLQHVASGTSCKKIAHEMGQTPGQLRTRLCRLRSRLQSGA